MKSVIFARARNLSHARRKATSVKGKGRSVSLGALDGFEAFFLLHTRYALFVLASSCSRLSRSFSY